MKNLLLILLVLFAFTAFSQTVVKPKPIIMLYEQGGKDKDTLGTSDTISYSVHFTTVEQLVYRVQIMTDAISDSAAYTATLQGSMTGDVGDWEDISAQTVSTPGDTLFSFANTAGNDWINLRVKFISTSREQKSAIRVYWYFLIKP